MEAAQKKSKQTPEPNGFVRVHHSHLYNPAYLRRNVQQVGRWLLLADGTQVPVTKAKRDYLPEQLSNIERR